MVDFDQATLRQEPRWGERLVDAGLANAQQRRHYRVDLFAAGNAQKLRGLREQLILMHEHRECQKLLGDRIESDQCGNTGTVGGERLGQHGACDIILGLRVLSA